MTRYLYHWLLRLHPPQFRGRYAREMQWIFDESADTRGRYALLGDAFALVDTAVGGAAADYPRNSGYCYRSASG